MQLTTSDQLCLLMGSCVEILCLRAALRFDVEQQGFPLRGQRLLTRSDVLAQPQLALLSPLFSYAQRLSELQLDETEAAVLAATWMLQVNPYFTRASIGNKYKICALLVRT